jgi:hypothetical protein
MNERIYELAKQAFGSTLDTDPILVFEAEKFADLLIRECVTICEQQRTKILQNPNDPSWTEHLAEVQINIKQHFGIK